MTTSAQLVDVIGNVLRHVALRNSSGLILSFPWMDHDRRAVGFEIRLNGIETRTVETVLLCDTLHLETCQEALARIREKYPSSRTLVVGSGGLELLKGTHTCGYDEMFRRLCEIPDDFLTRTLEKAHYDFDPIAFSERFQNRYFSVLHAPDERVTGKSKIVEADEYILEWAKSTTKRSPIILLGERGSGKTWELLHFCEQVFSRHQKSPWLYGPAFFIDLRIEAARSTPYRISFPSIAEAIQKEYPDVRYLWGNALAEAFITSGHTIACLDGFEEVAEVMAGDERNAGEFLRRICGSLPLGSRFILACRPTHFGSLQRLLNLEMWRNTDVRSTCEVLQLVPFEGKAIGRYVSLASRKAGGKHKARLQCLLETPNTALEAAWSRSLWRAVRLCASHPALLAAMTDAVGDVSQPTIMATQLLHRALVGNVVAYNVINDKATDIYCRSDNDIIQLGTNERLELLGELVWHLAVRGLEEVDMDNLPPRIARYYGLDLDAARKDIQVHTLFEPLPSDGALISDLRAGEEAGSNRFRFAVRFREVDETVTVSKLPTAEEVLSDERTESFRSPIGTISDPDGAATIGTSSVSGAFLLATHIAERLRIASAIPAPQHDSSSLIALDRWRPLGAVPLSPLAAGILRELLDDSTEWRRGFLAAATAGLDSLVYAAVTMVTTCASRNDFSVFTWPLRFLGHNLEAMGLVTSEQRSEFDPWWESNIRTIVRSPTCLPDYQMVLVPPPHKDAMPKQLARKGLSTPPLGEGIPFLMGVREVTNADYCMFLSSDQGTEWLKEHMTVAGSGVSDRQSRFATRANEYYLYFWELSATPHDLRFQPDRNERQHPVVYVSWYAAAAFCDWVAAREACEAPVYRAAQDFAEDSSATETPPFGYRLPTALEWSWTARNCRLDVKRPWELYPLILSDDEAREWFETVPLDNPYRRWMEKWRETYRDILLEIPKEHVPVLFDPMISIGTSGLMGNVKEWCHDRADSQGSRQHVILGATGSLGDASFSFDYGMTLFPENTNPDVGFRICRPLASNSVEVLRKRQTRIATIQTD